MRFCYFGVYNPEFGRNKVYAAGLRQLGHEVIECHESTGGVMKYWRLFNKLRNLHGEYDAVMVGYPGYSVVWIARLASRKPVVFDALCTLWESQTYSHYAGFLSRLKYGLMDWISVRCSDLILVETKEQKKFFMDRFGPSSKYKVLYTGATDEFRLAERKRNDRFIVLFRGRLTLESGIMHVLEAAHILRNEPILFRIVGFGYLLKEVEGKIKQGGFSNVELVSSNMDQGKMISVMADAALSLGQFENNPRLARTIPHKAFESFALGIPYLSGDAPAVREIVREGETGFLVPLADPKALAEKIRYLSSKVEMLDAVARGEREVFDKRFSNVALAAEIEKIVISLGQKANPRR